MDDLHYEHLSIGSSDEHFLWDIIEPFRHDPSDLPAIDLLSLVVQLTASAQSSLRTWIEFDALVRMQITLGTLGQDIAPYNLSSELLILRSLAIDVGRARNALLRTHQHWLWLEVMVGYKDLLQAIDLLRRTVEMLPSFWESGVLLGLEEHHTVLKNYGEALLLHGRDEGGDIRGWSRVEQTTKLAGLFKEQRARAGRA